MKMTESKSVKDALSDLVQAIEGSFAKKLDSFVEQADEKRRATLKADLAKLKEEEAQNRES
jgi:GTP cyclohydrolase FolE2